MEDTQEQPAPKRFEVGNHEGPWRETDAAEDAAGLAAYLVGRDGVPGYVLDRESGRRIAVDPAQGFHVETPAEDPEPAPDA